MIVSRRVLISQAKKIFYSSLSFFGAVCTSYLSPAIYKTHECIRPSFNCRSEKCRNESRCSVFPCCFGWLLLINTKYNINRADVSEVQCIVREKQNVNNSSWQANQNNFPLLSLSIYWKKSTFPTSIELHGCCVCLEEKGKDRKFSFNCFDSFSSFHFLFFSFGVAQKG